MRRARRVDVVRVSQTQMQSPERVFQPLVDIQDLDGIPPNLCQVAVADCASAKTSEWQVLRFQSLFLFSLP